jgi:hypothetical protein
MVVPCPKEDKGAAVVVAGMNPDVFDMKCDGSGGAGGIVEPCMRFDCIVVEAGLRFCIVLVLLRGVVSTHSTIPPTARSTVVTE